MRPGTVPGALRRLPLARQLHGYDRRGLASDVFAGIVLSALLVPAGMAYATASGLAPIYGLYATIVPLVVYALVGPSRVLVFAPDSSLAPLIAGLVVPLAVGDPDDAIALAGMMSVVAGVVCIAAGLARFGFLADLLSKPIRFGYLNGIAATVLVAQLPSALGFSGQAENLRDGFANLWRGVRDGQVEWWAVGVSAGALGVVLVVRRLDRRIPGALIAVAAAIVVAVVFDLGDRIALVGDLPTGFPAPDWPGIDGRHLPELLGAAVGVAFISFADTSVLSRTYALKTGQLVDPNEELVALGAVNVTTGFFQGFPVSSSSSRTPVAEEAGARTQVAGLVGAAVVTVVIVATPGVFRNLPSAALAAVVIAAVVRLVEISGVRRLAHLRRSEFVLAVFAFLSVAVFGPIVGIAVAIALSLLNFMRKAWRPHTTELVRVDGLKGYHDVGRHPEGHRIPGLLLYRFDGPLFFANGGYFEQDVIRRVDRAERPIRRVVITAEPITDIDSTAADELAELMDRLDERRVELVFAELKGHVRDRLAPYGLVDRVGRERFHRTVGEAVHAYVDEHGVHWRDWQEVDGQDDDGARDS